MVHQFESPELCYTYGYSINDNNKIICAFGIDNGNNEKVFIFNKKKKKYLQRYY